MRKVICSVAAVFAVIFLGIIFMGLIGDPAGSAQLFEWDVGDKPTLIIEDDADANGQIVIEYGSPGVIQV